MSRKQQNTADSCGTEQKKETKSRTGMLLQNNRTSQIALRGLFVAAAMVLSWLEAQIPVFIAVPGMKIGLTNLVVLLALYRLSIKDAIILNVIRIILVGFSFGNLFSICYSLAGGLLSGLVMILLKRTDKFSITTVSLSGGIFHNVGQILVAMVVLENAAVLYYLPVLWLSGLAAGIVVGVIGAQLLKKLPVFS